MSTTPCLKAGVSRRLHMSTNYINIRVKFDWNFDTTMSDETYYIKAVTVNRKLAGVGKALSSSSGVVSQATIEMENFNNRFSSQLTTGALYSDLENGKIYHVPVTIEVSTTLTPAYEFIFTGVCKISNELTLTPKSGKTITITAYSKEELLKNYKLSLLQSELWAYYQTPTNDSLFVKFLLEEAGYSSSDYEVGNGTFSFVPYTQKSRSILQSIWDIANTYGGFFYTNREGKFIYENAFAWTQKTSVQTYTRSNSSDIGFSYSEPNLTSIATVVGASLSLSETKNLYTAKATYLVPADDTLSLTINYSSSVVYLDTITYSADNGAGISLASDVSYTVTHYIDKSIFVFTNAHATYNAVIRNLRITGTAIETDSFNASTTSTESFWTDRGSANSVETSINNNLIQNPIIAKAITDLLVSQYQLPLLTYKINKAIGFSTLELGDRITITDGEILSGSREAYVTEIQSNYSASGWTQNITAVDADRLFSELDNYFIIDTNELNDSSVMFY